MSDPSPDFVVIGAGVAGVAVAECLAARGASVTVVEATQVCGGSSALNAGGVRQQFSQEINIRLARRTVALLEGLRDRGVDLGYRQVGYLFMISQTPSVPLLHQAIRRQNELAVPSEWLSVDDVTDMVPGVRPDGLVGATFCATDGYLDPHMFVSALAADARAAGARIRSQTTVVGFERHGERIDGVRLASGETIPAGTVVNCTGAWANGIAAIYGAELPIVPWRSQCFEIGGVAAMPKNCPVTIDFDNDKTYFHADAAAFLAGTDADDACAPSWDVPFDYGKAELLVQRLISRFSSFDDAVVTHGWSGMLELTPDENPIADWTHFENLYTMAGFSGHGLAIAPGLAQDVAEVLLGGSPEVDLAPYRLERFDALGSRAPAEAMSMR
jgi:sarcosine oxidase, subunit beta